MVHVQTAYKSKDNKGSHDQCDLAMNTRYKKPMPGTIHYGNTPYHANQQYTESCFSKSHMPPPLKNGLMIKMKKEKALYPKKEYIKSQDYG